MSKITEFAVIETDTTLTKCRELCEAARARLEKLSADPQKDGLDSEALRRAFRKLDRLLVRIYDHT